MKKNAVVTRFAPSPTGFMHIGGLRTALFAYLWAKKNNGTFILRIEDTDKAREVDGSIEHIMETLRWLGLEWDAGIGKRNEHFTGGNTSAKQSERLDTYKAIAESLIAKGSAYIDPYSAEEVEAFRKQASAEKRPFLFRNHRPDEKHMHVPEDWYGTRPLRFKVPVVRRSTWTDAVRGELTAGEEALDDFILIKADGYPTYNFAHIVDDFHMGVTHIMRADEFISSTPKFLSLYEALEITPPVFVTLPPILRADKTKKLGKRDGAKDVLEYRNEGYLVDAFTNFLAFVGWNPGTEQELFSREELITAFDIANIQKAGAVMNEDKLDWFNKEYLKKEWGTAEGRARIGEEILKRIPESVRTLPQFSEERARKVTPLIFDRMHVFHDVERIAHVYSEEKSDENAASRVVESGIDFFFESPTWSEEQVKMLVPKKGTYKDVVEVLEGLLSLLHVSTVDAFTSIDTVKELFWSFAEERGRGAVLWPLRVALTGSEKSPDPFTVAWIVGRDEVRARIEHALRGVRVYL